MNHSTIAPRRQHMPAVFDRRRFPRVSIAAPVLITDGKCQCDSGRCLDLSRGGLRVLSSAPLPEGSVVDVWVELDNGLSLECEAEVASHEQNSVGLRFLGMDAWQGARLAAYLQGVNAA